LHLLTHSVGEHHDNLFAPLGHEAASPGVAQARDSGSHFRGSKKKIGGGYRPVWEDAQRPKMGRPILFLLGVPGQSPRIPNETE
jgi:hypothetical protein